MESGRGTGVSVWIFFEVRVGGSGWKWAQIGRGGMRARQLAVSLDVHWPVWAAHRTGGRRQPEGSGLRHRVCSHRSRSMARGSARRWTIGSERDGQMHARQLFDAESALRTRSIEAKRKSTKSCRAREGSRRVRGGQWRGGLGKGGRLENWPCLWRPRASKRKRED
jgi:hypothetical protein